MLFKALLLVSAAAVAMAQYGHGGGGYGGGGYGSGGYGSGGYGDAGYGTHDYAQPIPYQYGYEIAGDHGEFKQNRQEHGDGHGNVQGSYGYTDAHGIYRQVDYVADAHGYRASVKTNEPGTDNQSPADVDLHAQPVQAHEPAYAAQQYGYGGHY